MKTAMLALALALGACSQVDSALQNNQDKIALACAGLKAADGVFKGFVAAGDIDLAGTMIEMKVMDAITPLCTPPYATDSASAIAKITQAVVQVVTIQSGYANAKATP